MKGNFWKKSKKPILALAPMAGITDSAFREICRRRGADIVYSEMASVSALFFKPTKTQELLKFNRRERPYIVQLFGKDPKHFAKATKIVTEIVKPDGIDINFGCPAKKVFGHGSGCALMPQKELAREIIQAVLENTDLPISLKIRAGIKNTTALEFIENIKDLNWKAIMVHGRTYEGSFSGPVDFALIEKIKALVPDRIVLANGGIMTPQEGSKILKSYPSIDGLGIARGAWGQPWIFEDIKKLLKNHPLLPEEKDPEGTEGWEKKSFEDISRIAIQHAKLIEKSKGSKGLLEIRKHL
ncbi:MAG: tRNA dihydrouridine synthase, partial [Patescibacteria group bacterium]